MKKTLLFLIVVIWAFPAFSQPCRQVIGYYPAWQWYDRNKLVKPASIDYSLYTIIQYAFFQPNADGSVSGTDSWADENILLGEINWSTNPISYYPNTSLVSRAHNNNVKVLLSIGGWTLSYNFPAIAANPAKRALFSHSCVQLLGQYNLDGIDIDWEYPGYVPNGGTPADYANYTLLLQQIRDSIDAYGLSVGKSMLLTSCVGAASSNMMNLQWPQLCQILDYINLMSYDYFGTWDALSNHNAPLYAGASGDLSFNLNSSVQYLLNTCNVPSTKITAGIPFYGRSAKTTGPPGLGVPITGGADNATFWQDEGTPLYYNVLANMGLFSAQWDNLAQVPFLTGLGNLQTFVSYDNPQSVGLKAQYIVTHNLAGAIIWEITGDYVETAPGSGVIAGTPLADTLNAVFCGQITSVQASRQEVRFRLYPNPAGTHLELSGSESVQFFLVNSQGQTVGGGYLDGQGTTHVDVGNLLPGIYFCVVQDGCRTWNQSFQIIR